MIMRWDLVEARYQVIYSDFDARTFKQWRQKAIAYLTTIVGPDHVYTRYFKDFVRQGGRKGLLPVVRQTERGQRTGVLKRLDYPGEWQRDICPLC